MRHQARLTARINELQTHWDQLSQILQALQQERNLENQADERLRLDYLIAQREAERQQVDTQLHELEQALQTSRSTEVVSPIPSESPQPLPPAHLPKPVSLFYSYSHKDEALREQLEKHLAILQRHQIISGWHDRAIPAGSVWEQQIHEHLETADIILLLVSADFLASDYCWGKEVTRAMERHEAGTARVIPVLLRAVDWTGAPFSTLQALPKDARPVTSWSNPDEAFADIARGIRQVVTSWRTP